MSDHAETPTAVSTGDKTLPMAVYVLYLLGFATGGVTSLVGLIIAYANRGSAGGRHDSHYTLQIRTFWIALVGLLIGAPMLFWGAVFSLILIGIPFLILAKLMLAATTVWFALRSILGLIYLSRDEAYPRPYSWLV